MGGSLELSRCLQVNLQGYTRFECTATYVGTNVNKRLFAGPHGEFYVINMTQITDEKLQALAKGFTVDAVRYRLN